ncbi:MAG: GGDEF domain-containing protein, partial [Methylothermaceae bacterium]|nr:GGDEF domain-containing protein [Methylothermaceae bacterium]
IPYNAWTFRAVDIGMLLDATLLALALTYQFRLAQEKRAHAEELARLDPLTGVNNRRAFYDLSSPIWNISLRHGHDLSVVLLDLDHFKRLNDNHGHAAGDAVLKAVAKVLGAVVREQDVIARWGGEEFILLLPETDLSSAAGLAERLREAIARSRVTVNGRPLGVTASVGVASKCECHTNLEALITDADHCLYQAKANGRNCIAVVTPGDLMETDGTVAIDSVT